MTEPTRLSPEEPIRAREFFIKHYEGDSDFNLNSAYQFAEAFASHVSAAGKAKIAELEEKLAQQHAFFVECNDILRKELEAAEARVKELEKYAQHAKDCGKWEIHNGRRTHILNDEALCTCGLRALLEGK